MPEKELSYKIIVDEAGGIRSIKKVGKATEQVTKQQKKAGNELKAVFGGAAAVVGTQATGAIIGLGKEAVLAAGRFQQTNVAFKTFLGDAERAKALIAELEGFSALTPFTSDEVLQAGKALLAFGVEADNITDSLRRIGDISSATGKNFNELSVIFGKARVQGTLFAEDINQLTEAGIPVLGEFAKILEVDVDQVKKLGSEGKITFDVLEQAFANLTNEGGRFFNLTAEQSQTLLGRLSTLDSQLSIIQRNIGQALTPDVERLADAVSKFAGNETAVKSLQISFIGLISIVKALVNSALVIPKSFIELGKFGVDSVKSVIDVVGILASRIVSAGDAIAKLVSGDFKGAKDAAADATQGIGEDFAKVFDKLSKDLAKSTTDLLEGVGGSFTDPFKALVEGFLDAQSVLKGGVDPSGEIDKTKKDVESLGDSAEKTTGFFKKLKDALSSLGDNKKVISNLKAGFSFVSDLAGGVIDLIGASQQRGIDQSNEYADELERIQQERLQAEVEAERMALEERLAIAQEGFDRENELEVLRREREIQGVENRRADFAQQVQIARDAYQQEATAANAAALQQAQAAQRQFQIEQNLAQQEEKLRQEQQQKEAQREIEDFEREQKLKKEEEQLEEKSRQREKQIAKEQFEAQKKISIAQATISAFQAAASAASTVPGGPITKSIAAAAALALGLAQVSSIKNQEFPGFQEGGEIGGPPGTERGDRLLVRANRGETVLPRREASDLLDFIRSSGISGGRVVETSSQVSGDTYQIANATFVLGEDEFNQAANRRVAVGGSFR